MEIFQCLWLYHKSTTLVATIWLASMIVPLAGATAALSPPEDEMVQDARRREKGTKNHGTIEGALTYFHF
jgi:hypothetical protein